MGDLSVVDESGTALVTIVAGTDVGVFRKTDSLNGLCQNACHDSDVDNVIGTAAA